MRKLSELLRICTKYHSLWNTSKGALGMCAAANRASYEGDLNGREAAQVKEECMKLVLEVDVKSLYLEVALPHLLYGGEDIYSHLEKVRETVVQTYEAWIDKLESEGK